MLKNNKISRNKEIIKRIWKIKKADDRMSADKNIVIVKDISGARMKKVKNHNLINK